MADEMLEIGGLLYGPFNDTDKRPTLAQVEEMLMAERLACAERAKAVFDRSALPGMSLIGEGVAGAILMKKQ